jgi:hypothetical protein
MNMNQLSESDLIDQIVLIKYDPLRELLVDILYILRRDRRMVIPPHVRPEPYRIALEKEMQKEMADAEPL